MLLKYLSKLDLPRASDLSPTHLYHLVIAYVLICLPMLSLFPLWLTGIAFITIALKVAAIRWHFSISKWLIAALMVMEIALIAVNFPAFGKEYAGIALLFIIGSLKLLEAREQRDAFILMLIYLLLIMGALMAQQSPLAFIYLVGCFLYNIYVQMRIAQPNDLAISLKQNLKAIAKVLLVSLPFVVVLFFLFPRMKPLWKQPASPRVVTGLSDEMTPNSLSELTMDGSLAFRVQFANNKIPDNNLLYWRGPVLVNFDGKTWRRDKTDVSPPQHFRVDQSSKVDYTIYHNGSTRRWIVPLDLPSAAPQSQTKIYLNRAFEMGSPDAINKPSAFQISAYTRYHTGSISQRERRKNVRLPADIFPLTRQLAARLKAQSTSDGDFANRIWRYFNEEGFVYYLDPPVGNSDLDTFLFENKTGYCEHYASAFVVMLRSQGVPSRVVTGYQGGQPNSVSEELEVKQLNAHAWAEVYLADKGWVRYDPTAAVAPARISNGSPFGAAQNTDSIATTARWEEQSDNYRQLSETLRAMNAFWQNWVINYNNDKQNSLWEKLGLSALKYVIWIIVLAIVLPLVLVIIWWYKRRKRRHFGDKVQRTMQPFIHYLSQQGMYAKPSQPLTEAFTIYANQLGDTKKLAERVISHYYHLRYGQSDGDTRALEKSIAHFIKNHRKKK